MNYDKISLVFNTYCFFFFLLPCQWVLKKPNIAVFFGAVGKDKYSEILKLKANEDGLDVKYQYSSEKPTGEKYLMFTY